MFLRRSQCGFANRVPYVCCANDENILETTSNPKPVEQTTDKNEEVTEEPSKVAFPDGEPAWLKKLKEKLPQQPNCGLDAQDRIWGGTVSLYNEVDMSYI